MHKIKISTDFTRTPGIRFRSDGPYSGQEFREKFLEPLFINPNDNSIIVVDLDDTRGYATSFLEEAFGGLARIFSIERVLKRFQFISKKNPLYIDEIIEYVNECNTLKYRKTKN